MKRIISAAALLALASPALAQQMCCGNKQAVPSSAREAHIWKCFGDAPWVDDGWLDRCIAAAPSSKLAADLDKPCLPDGVTFGCRTQKDSK